MTVHHAADEPGRSAEAPDSRHFDGFLPDRFRKDEGLVVLIYHEQRNIVPYMIFKALKYAVLDRFTAKVVVRERVLAGQTLWPLQHLAGFRNCPLPFRLLLLPSPLLMIFFF